MVKENYSKHIDKHVFNVVVDDEDLKIICKAAKEDGVTVAQWIQGAIDSDVELYQDSHTGD